MGFLLNAVFRYLICLKAHTTKYHLNGLGKLFRGIDRTLFIYVRNTIYKFLWVKFSVKANQKLTLMYDCKLKMM